MRKVCIQKLVDAAEKIRKSGTQVTVPALAKELALDINFVYGFVRGVRGLHERLGVRNVDSEMLNRYRYAAMRLHKKRIPVTHKNLCRFLKLKRSALRMYLWRHKELADEIGVITEAEARNRRVLRACELAAAKLLPTGKRITYAALAAEVGVRPSYLASRRCGKKVVKVTIERAAFRSAAE